MHFTVTSSSTDSRQSISTRPQCITPVIFHRTNDGSMLSVSSTDGYVTFITFAEGELGKAYKEQVVGKPEAASDAEKPSIPIAQSAAPQAEKAPSVNSKRWVYCGGHTE